MDTSTLKKGPVMEKTYRPVELDDIRELLDIYENVLKFKKNALGQDLKALDRAKLFMTLMNATEFRMEVSEEQ